MKTHIAPRSASGGIACSHDAYLASGYGRCVYSPPKKQSSPESRVNKEMEPDTTTSMRLLRLQEVVELTSLSASLIYGLIREGQFPAPLKLSANRRAWTPAAIQAWLRQKEASAPDRERAQR
jgi:prophage regulatory protein